MAEGCLLVVRGRSPFRTAAVEKASTECVGSVGGRRLPRGFIDGLLSLQGTACALCLQGQNDTSMMRSCPPSGSAALCSDCLASWPSARFHSRLALWRTCVVFVVVGNRPTSYEPRDFGSDCHVFYSIKTYAAWNFATSSEPLLTTRPLNACYQKVNLGIHVAHF